MEIETEVVRGRPIRAEGRRLVPVARRTVGVWRRATIGRGVSARGGSFVRIRPVGVMVREGEEERLVPIPDRTRQILRRFLAAAVLVMLFSLLVDWVVGGTFEEEGNGE